METPEKIFLGFETVMAKPWHRGRVSFLLVSQFLGVLSLSSEMSSSVVSVEDFESWGEETGHLRRMDEA